MTLVFVMLGLLYGYSAWTLRLYQTHGFALNERLFLRSFDLFRMNFGLFYVRRDFWAWLPRGVLIKAEQRFQTRFDNVLLFLQFLLFKLRVLILGIRPQIYFHIQKKFIHRISLLKLWGLLCCKRWLLVQYNNFLTFLAFIVYQNFTFLCLQGKPFLLA